MSRVRNETKSTCSTTKARDTRASLADCCGFAVGVATCDRFAYDGRDLCAEELDRPHHLVVGHCANRDLQQEPLVAEDLVLEEDLVDHVLRAADEVCAAPRARRVEVLSCHRPPAAFAADLVHH